MTTSSETSATSSKDQFTYLPSVTSVNPISGPAAGGTVVTIDGSGFTAGSTVKFGTAPATGVTDVSATEIQATAASRSRCRGYHGGHVRRDFRHVVERPVHLPAEHYDRKPELGPGRWRQRRHDRWIGLQQRVDVKFGTVPATNVTYVSGSEIEATAPTAGAVGVVDITVTTSGETSAIAQQ